MQADTERELRHNLEEAQKGLVKEFQAHQQTKTILADMKLSEDTLREQLRQAHLVIAMLNEQLALRG